MCTALLLSAALAVAAYSGWERRYQTGVAAGVRADSASSVVIGYAIQGGFDPRPLVESMQAAQIERMDIAARHQRRRAVLRPVFLTYVLLVVPVTILGMLWVWFGSRYSAPQPSADK